MDDAALQTVFQSAVTTKLISASLHGGAMIQLKIDNDSMHSQHRHYVLLSLRPLGDRCHALDNKLFATLLFYSAHDISWYILTLAACHYIYSVFIVYLTSRAYYVILSTVSTAFWQWFNKINERTSELPVNNVKITPWEWLTFRGSVNDCTDRHIDIWTDRTLSLSSLQTGELRARLFAEGVQLNAY